MIFNSDGGGTGGKKLPILTTPGSAADLRSGKELIGADGEIITGSVTSRISSNVTTSNNVVTIPAGIYDSQVQKTVGTAKSAATYTPGTSDQTISSGYYLTGAQTIKGDSNLVASNIKSGVSIFGVTGSLENKAVAKVVDFYIDAVDEYAFNLALDTPLKNIESIYFVYIQTDGTYSVIPPENYYDNDITSHIESILYTDNIKFASIIDPPTTSSSFGDPSMSVITDMLQQSPSIIRIYLEDRTFLNSYDPNYSGTGKFIGYAIGEKSTNNTYYMKNIALSEQNRFYGAGVNTFTNTYYSARWALCRLYFDFTTSASIRLAFTATDPGTEYLVIGNLNQTLNDDKYVDSSYYYTKSFSSNIDESINYSIPQGKSYIDIKICSNSTSRLESDFRFSVFI